MTDLGQCTIARPALMRLVGSSPSGRLLQSPAFPGGEADGLAMRALPVWSGCLPGTPGDRLVVSGRTLVRWAEVPLVPNTPIVPIPISQANEEQSAALPVKLRITRDKWPGWTIIDSDRSLVIDAGEKVVIEALVPPTWYEFPTPPVAEPSPRMFVDLYVRACPLRLAMPTAQLTWFAQLADGEVVVRPRGARALQIFGPNIGGSQWTLNNGAPLSGGVPVGSFQIAGGFINADIRIGAASHLVLLAGGGTPGPFYFAWDIE